MQKEHVGNYLKSLTMPTLIVWGSRDRVVPLEHGALMARHRVVGFNSYGEQYNAIYMNQT